MSAPEEGAIRLAETLNAELSPGEKCDVQVDTAENKTYGALADLCESALQLGFIDTTQNCLDAVEDLRPTLGAYADLLEIAVAMEEDVDVGDIVIERKATLNSQLAMFRAALDRDPTTQIVIVAHSQGNLFANEALAQLLKERGANVLERVAIVAVATPAPDVLGGGDPRPHTTLREDFIHHIPGALPPNVVDVPDGQCGLPWECHNFTRSYLVSDLAKARIVLKTKKAIALGAGRVGAISPPSPILSSTNQTLRILGSGLEPNGTSRTAVIVVLPDRTVSRLEGQQIVGVDEMFIDIDITLANVGQYSLQIVDSDARRSDVLTFPVASANSFPRAAFSMSSQGQTKGDGKTLSIAADPITNKAVVRFVDHSTDPDADDHITSWQWKADTRDTALCEGPAPCDWGFTPGHYQITLTVRDVPQHESTATGTVIVNLPDPVISRVDPATIFASPNDQPVVLTGLAFRSGLTVTVGLPGGGTSTLSGTAQIPNVTPSSIQLLVTFADPGPYRFTVINHDGGTSEPLSVTVSALPTLANLRNTGTGPEGSSDSYWTLLSGPTCPGGNCQVFTTVSDGFPIGPHWTPNNETSKWVEPIGGTVDSHPVGRYVYRLSVDIGDADPASVVISGQLRADDHPYDITLNEIYPALLMPVSGPVAGYVVTPFTLSEGFRRGINTIDFAVDNAICNGCGATNPTGIRVELTGKSYPAVAHDDSFLMEQGGTLSVPAPGVLANDTTPEGFQSVEFLFLPSTPAIGLTNSGDGGFVVNLGGFPGGNTGPFTLQYVIHTSQGDSNIATVEIDVRSTASPLLARDDSFSMAQGTTLTVAAPGVVSNDTIAIVVPPGTTVRIEFLTIPPGFFGSSDGSFSYTPDPTFVGNVSFRYLIHAVADSNIATGIIAVAPVPIITGVLPNPIVAGPNTQTVLLSGSGFAQPLQVSVKLPNGGALLTLSETQTSPSAKTVLATFADPGQYSITVIALGGIRSNTWSFVVQAEPSGGELFGGLMKSTDGGASWVRLAGTPIGFTTHSIAVDPHVPSRIYAATSLGFETSTDGGTTWRLSGGSQTNAFELVANPTAQDSVIALGFGAVYRSNDAGQTYRFQGVPPGTVSSSSNALAVDPTNGQVVYVGISRHVSTPQFTGYLDEIFRSADGGTTWSLFSGPFQDVAISSIAVKPSDGTVLFAASGSTVAIAPTDQTVYIATGAGKIRRNGVSVNTGLPLTTLSDAFDTDLIIDPSNSAVVYAVFTWITAGAWNNLPSRMFKTVDAGAHWIEVPIKRYPSTNISTITLDPNNPQVIYATVNEFAQF